MNFVFKFPARLQAGRHEGNQATDFLLHASCCTGQRAGEWQMLLSLSTGPHEWPACVHFNTNQLPWASSPLQWNIPSNKRTSVSGKMCTLPHPSWLLATSINLFARFSSPDRMLHFPCMFSFHFPSLVLTPTSSLQWCFPFCRFLHPSIHLHHHSPTHYFDLFSKNFFSAGWQGSPVSCREALKVVEKHFEQKCQRKWIRSKW